MVESEISATNLESVGKSIPAKRKGAGKRMGQSSSDYIKGVVSDTADKLTLGPQRRAVSDWVSQKEDQVKNAYQQAKNKLEGPTRYDYSKSKLKVSGNSSPKILASNKQRTSKRTTGKRATGY